MLGYVKNPKKKKQESFAEFILWKTRFYQWKLTYLLETLPTLLNQFVVSCRNNMCAHFISELLQLTKHSKTP